MLRKVVFVLVASLLLVNHSFWMPRDVHAKDEVMHLPSLQDAQEAISQSRGFFTENKGQWDPEILFVGNTDFGKVAFTREAIFYQMIKVEEPAMDPFDPEQPGDGHLADPFHDRLDPLYQKPTSFNSNIIELSFVDAETPEIEGLELLPHYHNYFIGNDSSKWATECRNFAQVSYTDVWEGIDLSYFFSPEGLKYEYYVHPHAQMEDLKVMVEGAELQENNNYLSMITPLGSLQDDELLVYRQDTGLTIPASFMVEENTFSFQGIPEERNETIVIDPLVYSTYLGGKWDDSATSIKVDVLGNAYVAGFTGSSDFPTTPGAFQENSSGLELAFVTKLNPQCTALVYSTYLGKKSMASCLDIDTYGNVYIAGNTQPGYPTTPGAFQEEPSDFWDVFVTKLNPQGTALVYSTYLGGESFYSTDADIATSIAVDSQGNAYVAGHTGSSAFPTTPGAFQDDFDFGSENKPNHKNAFVTKLNPQGSALVYSTYLGGSIGDGANSADYITSISLDMIGNAYVTGSTNSTDFPTTPGAFQETYAGGRDAFVTKINPQGTSLVYSTYLGGKKSHHLSGDFGMCIKVDLEGNAYVGGHTGSSDFPTTPGVYQESSSGIGLAFVTKINPQGAALLYSTYLGEENSHGISGLVVTAKGNAYVTGDGMFSLYYYTSISSAFVFILDAQGKSLLRKFYLSRRAESKTSANSIVVDAQGHIFIAGRSYSGNIPTTPGAFQETYAGEIDAFIVKLNLDETTQPPPKPPDPPDNRGSVNFHSNPSGASISINQTHYGKTPISIKLPAGKYNAMITLAGYKNEKREFVLSEKQEITIHVDLKKIEDKPPIPPGKEDYPILLVHGFQFFNSYNPIEIWDYMIRSLSGQDLRFLDKKEAYTSENKNFRKQLVQMIPIDASEGHYVYKIPALTLNNSFRTVYIVDYNYLLFDKKDPVNSKRSITVTDIRVYAANLKRAINMVKLDSNSDKVDIIAHSMGGLVARTYIEENALNSDYAKSVYPETDDGPRQYLPTYENDVHRLIMLGTPNHGTQIAKLSFLLSHGFPELRDKYGEEFKNHICLGQMETNSKFLKILNYEKDQNWNINNEDILHPEVHYHLIGGIIPSNRCGLLMVPKIVEKCMMNSFYEISEKLSKNENKENLFGYDDGLVPANSARLYNSNKLSRQNNNLNHIILYVDHSQLICINEAVLIIKKLLSNSNEKINTEHYFRDQTFDLMYTLLSAYVFSPATLQMHSGNEVVGFDIPNTTQNAYLDYLNGSIQWFNPPEEQFTYRLEGYEEGTYGVRFTSVDFKAPESVPLVYETHGLPTSDGRVDQIHIDWNSKDVKMESDINGDGVIDQVITAPGAPSSLSAIFEQSFVRLSWQASSSGSSPLKGYSVFRRGVQEDEFVSIGFVTAGSNLTYIDSSMVKDKSYVYYIQAVDTQNVSSISSNFALIDREGPEIDITHPAPDMNLNSSSIEVRGFVRDMSGVRAVWVNNVEAYYDKSNESFVSRPIQVDQAQFTIMVKAKDMAGNQSIKSIQVRKKLPTIIELTIGSTVAIVTNNGQMQMMNIDLAPFVRDARTFVPLRFIAEAFGAKVDWYYDPLGKSKGRIEITFTRADTSMVVMKMRDLEQVVIIEEYAAGSVTPRISRYTMDVAPFIVRPQGRTVVPIRFIAEGFGARVEWEPHAKKITITMDT